MNLQELYEFLDIEDPSEFEYFENIAGLLECEEEIEYEALCGLLEKVDRDKLKELIKNYFEELSDFLPPDATDFFLLMDKARLALSGACEGLAEAAALAEEIDKFRLWYARESEVLCTPIGGTDALAMPVSEALALCRLEGIGGEKYSYDFSGALDYSPEEYVMSFAEMDLPQ